MKGQYNDACWYAKKMYGSYTIVPGLRIRKNKETNVYWSLYSPLTPLFLHFSICLRTPDVYGHILPAFLRLIFHTVKVLYISLKKNIPSQAELKTTNSSDRHIFIYSCHSPNDTFSDQKTTRGVGRGGTHVSCISMSGLRCI